MPEPPQRGGPAAIGPMPPLDAEGRGRRAIVATSLCLCGASPSFMLAFSEFSVPGLVLGVAAFAGVLVLISWSGWFRRRLRMPHVRRSLSIVYWGRVALSVAWPVLIIVDGFPGLFAIGLVQQLGFIEPGSTEAESVPAVLAMNGVLGTFLIVLVQGTFLNVILLIAALGLWAMQRVSLPSPPPVVGTTFCRRCGYCRDGFAEDHPCPECGDARPPLPWSPTWVDRWSMVRLSLVALAMPFVVVGVGIGLMLFFGLP